MHIAPNTTSATTNIATTQAKGIKLKLLKNILADFILNQNQL